MIFSGEIHPFRYVCRAIEFKSLGPDEGQLVFLFNRSTLTCFKKSRLSASILSRSMSTGLF